MKEKNILFRCDGSNEIGMGHVVRCLALASELRDDFSCTITFAMRKSELGIQKVRASYPVVVAKQNNFNYELWLIRCIQDIKANILIMDVRDGLSRATLRKIKQITSIKVITIDDPEDKRLEADMAFYPPVPQVKEMNWNDYKGKLFTGWEYVILRKEFLKTYPKPKNAIPNIFVSMGATDPKDMISFVVESLEEIEYAFHANIIIGEGYKNDEKLFSQLSKVNFSYQVLINPPQIATVMSKSDLAIISFGQTASELAKLRIPSFYLYLSQDHQISSQFLINSGLGVGLGQFEFIKKKKLVEIISCYLNKESYKKVKIKNSFRISNVSKTSKIIYKISTNEKME